jgi:hypothetical protein
VVRGDKTAREGGSPSQRAIAKKVGVDQKTVHADLRSHDKKPPHPRTVYQISHYTKPRWLGNRVSSRGPTRSFRFS